MPHEVETIDLAGFAAIGIEVRTNNDREMEPRGAIAELWGKWVSEALAARIPSRADQNVVAVYTDYADDEHGDYTFFIGVKVASTDQTPDGMVTRTVPGGRYRIFSSDFGPLEAVVPEVWQHIWGESDSGRLARNYLTDFEIYDERTVNPNDAQVDVYIGVN